MLPSTRFCSDYEIESKKNVRISYWRHRATIGVIWKLAKARRAEHVSDDIHKHMSMEEIAGSCSVLCSCVLQSTRICLTRVASFRQTVSGTFHHACLSTRGSAHTKYRLMAHLAIIAGNVAQSTVQLSDDPGPRSHSARSRHRGGEVHRCSYSVAVDLRLLSLLLCST
jgi:hypothetical protein